jgi:hypothetical protein
MRPPPSAAQIVGLSLGHVEMGSFKSDHLRTEFSGSRAAARSSLRRGPDLACVSHGHARLDRVMEARLGARRGLLFLEKTEARLGGGDGFPGKSEANYIGQCSSHSRVKKYTDVHTIAILHIIAVRYFLTPDRRANIPFPCMGNTKYKS